MDEIEVLSSRVTTIIDNRVLEQTDEGIDRIDFVRDAFEEVIATINPPLTSVVEISKPSRRPKNARPSNWTEIADHFNTYRNVRKAMKTYGLQNLNSSVEHWRITLNRWLKDLTAGKLHVSVAGRRLPAYGAAIDNQLLAAVQKYNLHGIPMTDHILKLTLIDLLLKGNRRDILDRLCPDDEHIEIITGDKSQFRFGKRWAHRFYNRHNFPSRRATTKMREDVPVQYHEKVDMFTCVLSRNIRDHNIPDALVLNGDETNTQFVPTVKNTRVKKGTRRVRITGVGYEKPQITVTISCTATGKVLEPTQLIFGGKTKRCHPNSGTTTPPDGQYYDHTQSHWQTPATFITYISKCLIPYRLQTIQSLGLAADQKMIYILDLHYSHKDPAVLALFKANNIIPIFIPAGCTDLHQVCDVVLNKPYKNGVSRAFVDYVSDKFVQWQESNPEPGSIFMIDLSGGIMKPQLPSFVMRGIRALQTDAMKLTIIECFKTSSMLDVAKQDDTFARATISLPQDISDMPVEDDVEPEEDVGTVQQVEEHEERASSTADNGEDITNNLQFDIEILEEGNADKLEESSSISSSDEDTDGDEEDAHRSNRSSVPNEQTESNVSYVVVSTENNRNKRVRHQNTMIGAVGKGKYSRA